MTRPEGGAGHDVLSPGTPVSGRYRIERELGRGGMATVYLARDLPHDRLVALKTLHPELSGVLGADRFLREISIAARLQHPNILPLFDSGTTDLGGGDARSFYVMPYVTGESLRARLKREPQLGLDEAIGIGRQIAAALDYAHGQGVIHRDIKPENILLEDGRVVVADFGIAKALDAAGGEKLTQTGLSLGTPAYMSPEQATGSGVDARSDVYSLACVLYEMLVGDPPFLGSSARAVMARHALDPVPSVRTARPEIPDHLEAALRRGLAKVPGDRFASAGELAAAAAGSGPTVAIPAPRSTRGLRLPRAALLAGAALVAVGAGVLLGPLTPAPKLDPDRVLVAPFDVRLAPNLGLWREGLMDVLARNLDGAGPLHAVPPSVALRRSGPNADAASARDIGRRAGAGLVVVGQLIGAGSDSVRLKATMLDVAADRVLAEVEGRDVAPRMDRLADSITMQLLRGLGGSRPIGAVRHASLGWSRSMPALKAFLQGEQFFRRGAGDSALAYYRTAVAEDSTFTLALRRLWMVQADDWNAPLAYEYALRAGLLNHGLPPRESLLVSADCTMVVSNLKGFADSTLFPNLRRAVASLEEASRRYPDDAEIWTVLGYTRFYADVETTSGPVEALRRAIALDSGFAPAYGPVLITLTLNAGDDSAARRYVARYLAFRPSGTIVPGMRLVARLLDPVAAAAPETDRLLDTLPLEDIRFAHEVLWPWPDSAETAVRLARRLERREPERLDTLNIGTRIAMTLASRGHLHEEYATGKYGDWWGLADLAWFGVVPAETTAVRYDGQLRHFRSDLPLRALSALGWWAKRGDTASLRRTIVLSDSLSRPPLPPDRNRRWRYVSAAARAYLALARHDTAEALRHMLTWPDYLCRFCYQDQLAKGELLMAVGRDREAAIALEPAKGLPFGELQPRSILVALARGRVNERLGERDKAIKAYSLVVAVWRNADPELHPFVDEARAGLARLTGEPQPRR
jgi:eukaryotic-like serine/threonine-protein kinase